MSRARIKAKYPILAAAFEDMAGRWARHKKNATAIARKAGLRSRGTLDRARTVIDGYVHPLEEHRARQWLTDLSGMGRASFVSRSSAPVYLYYWTDGGSDLSPGFSGFVDSDGNPVSAQASDGGPNWVEMPEEQKTVLRLTISTEPFGVGMNPDTIDSPFSVALQVAP